VPSIADVDHLDGGVHALENRRQVDVLLLGVGHVLVGIDADDLQLVGAEFVCERGGAEADRAGDRHDDVGAFVIEVLGKGAAVVQALEVVGEQPFLGFRIPAQNAHRVPFFSL
jgi:hypothetical protein